MKCSSALAVLSNYKLESVHKMRSKHWKIIIIIIIITIVIVVIIKRGKVRPEQDMKVQRGSIDIALLFL
jgi:hypothetical protein